MHSEISKKTTFKEMRRLYTASLDIESIKCADNSHVGEDAEANENDHMNHWVRPVVDDLFLGFLFGQILRII